MKRFALTVRQIAYTRNQTNPGGRYEEQSCPCASTAFECQS